MEDWADESTRGSDRLYFHTNAKRGGRACRRARRRGGHAAGAPAQTTSGQTLRLATFCRRGPRRRRGAPHAARC
eukprot:8162442-Lingulodinium_polyedra.AAC.1